MLCGSVPSKLRLKLAESLLKQMRVLNDASGVVQSVCSSGFKEKGVLISAMDLQMKMVDEFVGLGELACQSVLELRNKYKKPVKHSVKKVQNRRVTPPGKSATNELTSKIAALNLKDDLEVKNPKVLKIIPKEQKEDETPKHEETPSKPKKSPQIQKLSQLFENSEDDNNFQVKSSRHQRGLRKPRASVVNNFDDMTQLEIFRSNKNITQTRTTRSSTQSNPT